LTVECLQAIFMSGEMLYDASPQSLFDWPPTGMKACVPPVEVSVANLDDRMFPVALTDAVAQVVEYVFARLLTVPTRPLEAKL
jgi:hypothetical protein